MAQEQVTIKVDCVATTFRYMTEKEREQAAAAALESKSETGRRKK